MHHVRERLTAPHNAHASVGVVVPVPKRLNFLRRSRVLGTPLTTPWHSIRFFVMYISRSEFFRPACGLLVMTTEDWNGDIAYQP